MEHSSAGDDLGVIPSAKGMHDITGQSYSGSNASLLAERSCRVRRTRRFSTVVLFGLLGFVYWISLGAPLKWRNFHALQDYSEGISATSHDNPSLHLRVGNDFNWTNHSPTKQLNWTDCYEYYGMQYQCTRLSVPLDYTEPDGEQAAVALIRLQSPYPPGHEKYKGPILFNPGGPGGSGVSMVIGAAPSFRKLIGDEFDFIGFDPRGVLFTTPDIDVFESSIEAAKFTLEMPASLNASSSAFGDAYVRSKLLGELAEMRARKYASHVSTVTVATDMLSIVNATGFDKLQFWGFSYGSVLGATFAAMFPDKVGRIIIDGVVDSEDYHAGLWSDNLRDADAALFDIYESCVRAGPEGCPIYEENAELVAERVDKLLAKIKAEPLSYLSIGREGPFGNSYGLFDYSMLKGLIFRALYNTHGDGWSLTFLLAIVESGDLMVFRRPLDYMFTCESEPDKNFYTWRGNTPTLAIACGDGPLVDKTLGYARAFYEKLARSTKFSDVWPYRLYCSGWTIRAKNRFNGSFEQNTSYPLLIIGNTADPVTPLLNAHKMSKGFNNSVVLTQNSSGHCSISATSICTTKAVRSYLLNGTLPEKGTVCQTESSIFGSALDLADSFTAEDQVLLQAADELRRMQIVPRLFDVSPTSFVNWGTDGPMTDNPWN